MFCFLCLLNIYCVTTINSLFRYLVLSLFSFLSKVFSFLTGLSSLLGPSNSWCLALPLGFAVWNVVIIIIIIIIIMIIIIVIFKEFIVVAVKINFTFMCMKPLFANSKEYLSYI